MADNNFNPADYTDYEELDLNGSIENESQFIDIPVGDYEGRIDRCEVGPCTWENKDFNGKKMLTVYINLIVDDQQVQISDNMVLVRKMEWKLSQFFLGTGQKKKGEPMPNLGRAIQEAPGLTVKFSYIEDKKRKRQDGTPYKNIGKYYEKQAPQWGQTAPATSNAPKWGGGF